MLDNKGGPYRQVPVGPSLRLLRRRSGNGNRGRQRRVLDLKFAAVDETIILRYVSLSRYNTL
jgi:hypothetical protein